MRTRTSTPYRAITLLLLALPIAAAESDCDNWNTDAFFETASLDTIERCIAGGADVNSREEHDGWTLLHHAAYRKDASPDLIATLLAAGANPNAADWGGRTPLHHAATPSAIAMLVAAGADPNAADWGGDTPLYYVTLADTVLATDDGTEEEGRIRLGDTHMENASLIAALVAAGANPNAADPKGWTPLHSARTPPVIAALLAAGADPNAADDQGSTPLHFGARNATVAMIAAGADPRAANNRGRTPLHFAESPSVIAALVAAGADPNAVDDEGRTPLHFAATPDLFHYTVALEIAAAAAVPALIDAGADRHRRDMRGWTALPSAIMQLAPMRRITGEVLRLYLTDGAITADHQWQRKGLHNATCWFGLDQPPPAMDCYYFAVNENPDDEPSPLVAFPVVRFRADDEQQDGNPVLVLGSGGAGRPIGLEADPQRIWSQYGALVAGSARDLYVIDPRGVGMAHPRLPCSYSRVSGALHERIDAGEEGAERNQDSAICKRHLTHDGRDMSRYNSAVVATDIEALRRALGVAQWVLWGNGYGTRYALTIARDHPGSVEALLLNGAAFPGGPPYPETRASDMERTINQAFDHCGRNGDCDPESLRARFWELVDGLEESPLTLTAPSVLSRVHLKRLELTSSRFLDAVATALRDDEFHEALPSLVQELELGTTATLVEVLNHWLDIRVDMGFSEPVAQAHYCAEEFPFVDFALAATDARGANRHLRQLAMHELGTVRELCSIWNVEPAAALEDEPVRTSIPTLFLQGALDATLIHRSEDQLPHFAHNHVLAFDGSSHRDAVHSPCAMQAAAHFVQHKRIEERHRQCSEP